MRYSKVFLLFLIILFSCKDNSETENTQEAIPVRSYLVKKDVITQIITTSGKVAVQEEIKLSFKTGGIIRNIFVKEGQKISKGQLLANLDLTEIDASVRQAKENYNKALRDFERVKNLYEDSVITKENFQNMKTGLDIAESNLNIAEFNRDHSEIYAPYDGLILKKFVEENEIISPGMPIFIFGSYQNNWLIKVGLTDKDISLLKVGDKANVRFDAHPNEVFDASITNISAAPSIMSGTYEVQLKLINKNKFITSGMISKVQLFPSSVKEAYKIPLVAFTNLEQNKGSVFIISEDKERVVLKELVISTIIGEYCYVENGFDENQFIVIDGVEYLQNDSKIKILN